MQAYYSLVQTVTRFREAAYIDFLSFKGMLFGHAHLPDYIQPLRRHSKTTKGLTNLLKIRLHLENSYRLYSMY